MNNGGIDKFNAEQKKKYGDNYTKRDGYEEDYMSAFNKEVTKNFNKSLDEFYKTNKNYRKAQSLVDQYNMTSWDKLARDNAAAVQSVRDTLNDE